MSDPYIGEIRMFAGTFAPYGWLDCNGDEVAISDYDVLYSLIGTTYGGDGQNTFVLPDLRSRVPIGAGPLPGGSNYELAQMGGAENVTLQGQQVPAHTHPLMATSSGQQQSPANALPASVSSTYNVYGPKTSPTTLQPASVGSAGGSGPHANIQPYLGMRFIIAWQGIFPTQN